MIREVFGSYAHEDADIVGRFRAVYRALGIHLFVDKLDIDGGQLWKRYLELQIEKSDLFQLFWSAASAASRAVEYEWQHALKIAGKRSPAVFLRPVYWREPHPAPPQPLAEIHFRYFDPRNFGVTSPEADPLAGDRFLLGQ